jgi:predicted HicB family RNase H-like nuclease
MKTTLLLDDEIHRQAKQAAARLGIPLTRFIEEAIRLRIKRSLFGF